MLNRINFYIFTQIIKSCVLIFFIFLSISWLLQLTRLFTLTNLIQIDILNVIFLSFYLIPNLLTIIIPFILIFGILLCFLKLNKDREIIAIYSLGLELKPIKYSLIFFSIITIILYLLLNFYISPKIYEQYKLKEHDLRNTINFDKMVISNFVHLNENTTIDFKKNNNMFEDIFISFFDQKDNIIYSKKGFIKNNKNQYIFQLNEGFKISIDQNNEIEKLEFKDYVLKVDKNNSDEFDNYDRNTLTIFDDIQNKNYINISFKVSDIIIAILIVYFFYQNNIIKINFTIKNNIFFILVSIILLIINQLLKNSDIQNIFYIMSIFILSFSLIILSKIKKYE